MSIRSLPKINVNARPGLRSEITSTAFSRWNPDVHAAQDGSGENTISILDTIGHDWYGEGVTAKRVAAALRSIGSNDVVVNINSPGGDYFEGLAIYALLSEHPANVTIKILGIAASAASIIAMAGDTIRIARSGFLMIHNTWVVAGGDRHALRDVADWLEPFDSSAVDLYAARTGLDEADITSMLDRETWIGGKSAVEQGFADDFLESDEVSSSTNNSAGGNAVKAKNKMDAMLAKAGATRSERRDLFAALKGGMPGAALTGTQDAAVLQGVQDLLNQVKSI